jgi:hypothetical protein
MAGMPPPEMAKTETLLMRYIKRFHEKFTERLMNGSQDTLRSTAWQLDEYIGKNKKFKDAEFLKGVLATIEYAIQKKCGTKWSVERAKRDMRGRTRGVNQFAEQKVPVMPKRRIPISRELAKALADATLKPPEGNP